LFLIALGFVLVFGLFVYKNYKKFLSKKKGTAKEQDSKEEEYSTDKILQALKKQGGRATQKDIRKEIPLSEAKISLMIAELEHKGKVEKIKKGRGNIIILK
jgi:uncharacterized membrane protein